MLWPNINIESNAQYFIPIFHFVQCTRKNAKVQKTSYQYTLKLAIFQFDPVNAMPLQPWSRTGQNLITELITSKIMENYFKVLMYLSIYPGSWTVITTKLCIHFLLETYIFMKQFQLSCSFAYAVLFSLCLSNWLTYSLKY